MSSPSTAPGSTPPLHRAWIGIGANLGAAQGAVLAAIEQLRPLGLVAHSSLYRSAPQDAAGPDYINAVVVLDTPTTALNLLHQLQAIEAEFGRQRPYHHAPRTLDLDLLLHGSSVLLSEQLTLPHPRLHQRAFVLLPMLELAPDLQVPGLGPLALWLVSVQGQDLHRLDTLAPTMLHSQRRDP